MAKMSIAQLREIALDRFNGDYIRDMKTAKNLVNRFYRLSSMEYRLCILENDVNTYNRPYTLELEARTERMRKRLKEDLNEYGLTLAYYGIYPTLEENNGTQTRALSTWYY